MQRFNNLVIKYLTWLSETAEHYREVKSLKYKPLHDENTYTQEGGKAQSVYTENNTGNPYSFMFLSEVCQQVYYIFI